MTLDPDRVQKILNTALALPGDQRADFVANACVGDTALQAEVESLLKHAAEPLESRNAPTTPDRPPEGVQSVDSNIGRTIDRYTITSLLGEGGFGLVYRASQSEPIRRDVALKIIKPGMDSKAVLSRFESERQALALMDHPGVARILDAGTTDKGLPYFVMEYVKGIPLTKFADTNRLDLRERIELLMEACHAVQHAHAKGIIHRDLKPGNILATYENGRPAIKIIDFGIAKALNPTFTAGDHVTQEGRLIGTPEYMSPEQAQMSAIDVDTRSDVYSLGVLLYELLAGGLPFESHTLHSASLPEIQRIIREVEPPVPSNRYEELRSSSMEVSKDVARSRSIDPSLLQKRLKGDLDWIIMKCLDKAPVRRYATADALSSDLHRYLTNEPVEAGPPTLSYRFRKFAVRRTGLLASTALVFLVLLGGAITSTALWLEADAQRERVELRDRELTKLLIEYDEIYREIYLADGSSDMRVQLNELLAPSIDALLASSTKTDADRYRFAKAMNLLKQAELAGGRRSTNDGRGNEALQLREEALTIASLLTDNDPENCDYRNLLARSSQAIGDSYRSMDRFQDAYTAYQHAMIDAARCSTTSPRLAGSLQMSLGDMKRKLGETEASRQHYDNAMDLKQTFARNNPGVPMAQRDVANMHIRIAAILADSAQHEQALERYSKALSINTKLFNTDSEHIATHRRACGLGHSYMAICLLQIDQPDVASEHYTMSLSLLTENLLLNPSDARTRSNLESRLEDSYRSRFGGNAVNMQVERSRKALEATGN